MQKITPMFWFNDKAEEAARFYVSVFKDAKILEMSHYGAESQAAGKVLVVKFQLQGQEYLALNGLHDAPFSEAVSLMVNCKDQAEVDYYWDKLMADGGAPIACGWLKDKYGFQWQVTPTILMKYIQDKDKVKARRVMEAMMKMVKIDIAAIKKAYKG
ncbi:MAG TPA: VOC family protein [Gammaproteobacteria bacterium]|jgi:predicted 3-demethylubiquinone-9 3-methyltransferase (glyoxalase superfamily)